MAITLSFLLTAVFLGWGIYTLSLRYGRQIELAPALESATLGLLVLFYAFQFALLRGILGHSVGTFILSATALVLSGMALYGHMVTSLLSRGLTGIMMPTGPPPELSPHFGSAEQYERAGQFHEALSEYEAMARMFPADPSPALRVADTHVRLRQFEKALMWYHRCLAHTTDPIDSLQVTNRLVELHVLQRGDVPAAIHVLEQFAAANDESPYAQKARSRAADLRERGASAVHGAGPAAQLLEEEPGSEVLPGSLIGAGGAGSQVAGPIDMLADADEGTYQPGEELPDSPHRLEDDEDDTDDSAPGQELPGLELPGDKDR